MDARPTDLYSFAQRFSWLVDQYHGGKPARMARAVGLAYNTVWRYCRGVREPSGKELEKLIQRYPEEIFWALTGVEMGQSPLDDLRPLVASLDERQRAVLARCAQLLLESQAGAAEFLEHLFTYMELELRAARPQSPRRLPPQAPARVAKNNKAQPPEIFPNPCS